jgi:vacuolar iron transporter family protein
MSAADAWEREASSAYLYRVLAGVEDDPTRRRLFTRLAEEAQAQAGIWERAARDAGATVPVRYAPTFGPRLAALLLRRLGPRAMLPMLAAMKVRGLSTYSPPPPEHGMPTSVATLGQRHRSARSGGNLRAAVFGVNDGLVSNTSLLVGVAAATADSGFIVLSGVAGLLAGAFSMAAGEYVSVRSQREMLETQLAAEREELARYPDDEAGELALIYEARGLTADEARTLAARLIADPERALDTMAREELGVDPNELGSPWSAAIFSFVAFAFGATVPLLPFLLLASATAFPVALAAAALTLAGVGAAIGLFTGRSALYGAARMLCIGGLATVLTHVIGKLLGVTIV